MRFAAKLWSADSCSMPMSAYSSHAFGKFEGQRYTWHHPTFWRLHVWVCLKEGYTVYTVMEFSFNENVDKQRDLGAPECSNNPDRLIVTVRLQTSTSCAVEGWQKVSSLGQKPQRPCHLPGNSFMWLAASNRSFPSGPALARQTELKKRRIQRRMRRTRQRSKTTGRRGKMGRKTLSSQKTDWRNEERRS